MLNAAGSATPQALGTAAAGTSAVYSREDHVHALPTASQIGAVGTSDVISINHGGTGAITATAARTALEITPANIGAISTDQQSGFATLTAGTLTASQVAALTGDVTSTAGSPATTVVKLHGNTIASTTPSSGQVLTWDGAQWAPATNSSGGGGGANGLTYYLNQGTAADAPTTGITGTPHQLGRTGESGQTTVTTGTLTQNVWTLVAGFVSESTPIDPDVTLIPAGLWDFNIWAYGDANSNAGTSIRCRVYKYNGTTLTEIASPSSDQVINGTSAQYSLSVLVPQTTLELTDRIYVAIEARATGNGHSVTAQFGDSTPSHVHTSLPLVGGTGLWKSIAGVLQSPASLLVNADVASDAGIAWSKIAPSYFGAQVKVVGRDAATIQECINLCTGASSTNPFTVLIPPKAGNYVEPLTLKGSVALIGLTNALNSDAIQIEGSHTYAPDLASGNSNRIGFENLTFISASLTANTISVVAGTGGTKYASQLRFSGCVFSGGKNSGVSHISTCDNVSLYIDNCRFESTTGNAGSAGITQGNGPLYLSNNTVFDVFGKALDIPASTTVTKTATSTFGSYTLTVSDVTGLSVGQKISGTGLYSTTTVVSITAPSTVVMSTRPQTPSAGFTATFGQTPYVEIHDSVLAGKGAEVVRLGNGLLACNTSNFTNTASGGSGINMLTANTVIGMVNSSFSISDATAYTITAAAATCYAALESVSFSNSFLAAYSTLIGANVTVADYSARATSIENGGTGATTRQAALNALAGAVTASQVLAGTGSNITLRALAAADIPSLAASKITSGQLVVAQGGTGAATLTGLVKGTGTTAMVAAVAGTDYQAPIGTISGIVKGNGANALSAAAAADIATTLGSQTAAYVYAAPAASAGNPGFRALVGGDLPATFTQSQTFAAGTTTVAPFKFQAGVKLTTAVAHAVEWDGTNLYATSTTPTRRRVAYIDDIWSTVASPAPTGTIAFYAETHDVLYYQTAATGAWTLNITGTSAPVTLNTLMAIGQSRTVVLMVLQGATAYVPSIQIDGAAVTPKWGAEVSTGNASKTDMMSFTILKTAASTFTVFGSITKFA